jgi:hypothetical protein
MGAIGIVSPARLGSFDFFLFAVFNYPLPTSFINLLELNVPRNLMGNLINCELVLCQFIQCATIIITLVNLNYHVHIIM